MHFSFVAFNLFFMALSGWRRSPRLGEACYIVAVMLVTAVAMSDPNHPRLPLFIAALVVCLPALVGGLPVLFGAGALAWGLTHADSGGVTWPVTATYTAVLGLTALANVMIVRTRRRTRHA